MTLPLWIAISVGYTALCSVIIYHLDQYGEVPA